MMDLTNSLDVHLWFPGLSYSLRRRPTSYACYAGRIGLSNQ